MLRQCRSKIVNTIARQLLKGKKGRTQEVWEKNTVEKSRDQLKPFKESVNCKISVKNKTDKITLQKE